jgi:hypothetical protein
MYWENNKIREVFGTEIAGVVRALEGACAEPIYGKTREGIDSTASTMYQVDTEMNVGLVDVQAIVREAFGRPVSCNHSYDCCGCWFRLSIEVVEREKERSRARSFYIIETWARNV